MNVVTFGCRLNAYESDVINDFLKKYNLHDLIVVNTCSVTSEAERQALQKIRQLKRKFPTMRIMVTGCSVHMDTEKFPSDIVDYIVGNDDKLREETYAAIKNGTYPRISVAELDVKRDLPKNLISPKEKKVRGYLPIQTGCNYECTFCSVRKTRGKAKSLSLEHIINQAKLFAEVYQEIVLTGINISMFGFDLSPRMSLADLIKVLIKEVPEMRFISLSSLDPFTVDRDLIELYGTEAKLLPHVHLSIQAGDNDVLRLMKRRHSREKVIDVCKKLKAQNPEIRIGADIITGFPSETDERFANTLELVNEADLDFLHIFPFSRRPGTEAHDMPNQVEKRVSKARAKLLRKKIDDKFQKYLQRMVGTEVDFFVETENHGRTKNYIDVVPSSGKFEKINELISGKVQKIEDNKLVVEYV